MTELLERMRAGDEFAAQRLYTRVEPFLRSVARRSLGAGMRRQVESEDIADSAFRRVLESSARTHFESDGRVLGWMATIVRNRIRTLARKLDAPGGRPFLPLLEGGLPDAPGLDPVRMASAAEELARFREALARLPGVEQEVIVLRDFADLPFREVASLMGRPSADAARKLHSRALDRLGTAIRSLGRLPAN